MVVPRNRRNGRGRGYNGGEVRPRRRSLGGRTGARGCRPLIQRAVSQILESRQAISMPLIGRWGCPRENIVIEVRSPGESSYLGRGDRAISRPGEVARRAQTGPGQHVGLAAPQLQRGRNCDERAIGGGGPGKMVEVLSGQARSKFQQREYYSEMARCSLVANHVIVPPLVTSSVCSVCGADEGPLFPRYCELCTESSRW